MRKIYLSLVAAMMSVASFAQVTFTCTAGKNFGQTEGMDKLFDGDVNTKYCQNAGDDCYALVTASKAVYVWGYEMTTANDNEQYGRCVTRWSLYGTNDETVAADANSEAWVALATPTKNDQVQRKNFYKQRFFCNSGADETAYKYFKVVLNEGGFIQLSEFSLCYETSQPVHYELHEASDMNNAALVLDLNIGTKWEGSNIAGNWFTLKSADDQPHIVSSYSFTTHDDGSWPDRAPKHWKVEGSNDNAEWTLIDEVSNDPIDNTNYATFDFIPSNTSQAFTYVKVTLVAMKPGNHTQVAEFHLTTSTCTEHQWGDGEAVEATCTTEGTTTYTCTICGALKVDKVPATGIHTPDEAGYCTVCDHLTLPLVELAVTEGYNADVVVEATPVADHLILGIDNAKTGFIAEGAFDNATGYLPADGKVSTLGGYDVTVTYDGEVALRIGDTDEHVLTVTPAKAYGVHILGTSAGGASTTNVTVVYDDDTTTEATLSWADWYGGKGDGVAVTGLQRYYANNATEEGYLDSRAGFRLFEKVIKTDSEKNITAVKFQQTTNKTPVIMAVSYASADVTDAINTIAVESNGAIYNIAGQRVADNFRGIVIMNGKKYMK